MNSCSLSSRGRRGGPARAGSCFRTSAACSGFRCRSKPSIAICGSSSTRKRLRAARARAFTAGHAAAGDGCRCSRSADLLELKPRLGVRTETTFTRTVLRLGRCCTSRASTRLAGMAAPANRGRSTAAVGGALLTALGVAVLLSRSDPLRDTLLFVRFAQGTLDRSRLFCRSHRRSTFARRCSASSATSRSRSPALLCVAADRLRRRPGRKRREGEPRSGPADRSDPSAPGAISRRLLRQAVGTAARHPQQDVPRRAGPARAQSCRAWNTCCRC